MAVGKKTGIQKGLDQPVGFKATLTSLIF